LRGGGNHAPVILPQGWKVTLGYFQEHILRELAV
jgi:hypothetical protein